MYKVVDKIRNEKLVMKKYYYFYSIFRLIITISRIEFLYENCKYL